MTDKSQDMSNNTIHTSRRLLHRFFLCFQIFKIAPKKFIVQKMDECIEFAHICYSPSLCVFVYFCVSECINVEQCGCCLLIDVWTIYKLNKLSLSLSQFASKHSTYLNFSQYSCVRCVDLCMLCDCAFVQSLLLLLLLLQIFCTFYFLFFLPSVSV